jgi:acylphosphatase
MSNNQFTRARVFIYGQVQKVDQLGISGWIRNRSDGRVETLIVGEHDQVKKLLDWFKKGSPTANVEKVDVVTKEEINYNPFEKEFKINPTI